MKQLLGTAFFAAIFAGASALHAANLLTNGELTDGGGNETATGWSKSEPTLDGASNPIDIFRFQSRFSRIAPTTTSPATALPAPTATSTPPT